MYIATVFLAAALGLGAPASQEQSGAADLIAVTGCNIEIAAVPPSDGVPIAAAPSVLDIRFRAGGSSPIGDVTFAVTYDGGTTTVRDVGAFSPNETIDYRLLLWTVPATDGAQCRVVDAHYKAQSA